MGNQGFEGPSSLLYHVHQPTGFVTCAGPAPGVDGGQRADRCVTGTSARRSLPETCSVTLDRIPLLFNSDVAISFVRPQTSDELLLPQRAGRRDRVRERWRRRPGVAVRRHALRQGRLPGRAARHRCIATASTRAPARCSSSRAPAHVRTPRRYRNEYGQLLEHSPYSERDIRRPGGPADRTTRRATSGRRQEGQRVRRDSCSRTTRSTSSAGTDTTTRGRSTSTDFEPRVGRVHLPPPVHQTFEGDGFVVCSFCPRPYDFDPQAVPVPYNHSNVMSDEVLYYASAEFMSRKGIEYGSITLHPDGIAARPAPGPHRSIARAGPDRRTGRDGRHLPPAARRTQALSIEDRRVLPLVGRAALSNEFRPHASRVARRLCRPLSAGGAADACGGATLRDVPHRPRMPGCSAGSSLPMAQAR